MAELKVYLSAGLDRRFRMLAMSVFGYGRGSLSEAAVDALTKWCEEHEARKLDPEPKQETSHSNSDPAARAEERVGQTKVGVRCSLRRQRDDWSKYNRVDAVKLLREGNMTRAGTDVLPQKWLTKN